MLYASNCSQGSFFNYVAQILQIIDNLPTPAPVDITVVMENLHIVDISSTTYLSHLVNVV